MNISINTKELQTIIEATPASHNIMLIGKHGIGKSEILTSYFNNKGMKVVTLFLGQMADAGDLIGLPHKNEKTGKTDFMPPYWFPMDGQPIVLFLDELNRARPEILQTIMDLALNRKLAGRPLPEGSRIISAVNQGEEYQLTDLDPALISRFNIYEFNPSSAEWILWAINNGIDKRITDFIQYRPDALDGKTNKNDDSISFDKTPDRRAWKKVSDIISNKLVLDELDKKIICGVIGAEYTVVFFEFLTSNDKVNPIDILLDFEHKKDEIETYELHDFSVINEGIMTLLETQKYNNDENSKKISNNLNQYTMFMMTHDCKESMGHFASLISSGTYPNAFTYLYKHCTDVLTNAMSYISNIQ